MKKFRHTKYTPIEKLEQAIKNLSSINPSIRPLNVDGQPGGLIKFPKNDKREVIFVGDIHGNKKNLKAILQDSKNLYKLKSNELVIVFLGDIVHDDMTGHLTEMDSSVEIMDIMIRLINEYPNNIIYLRGNHDTFAPFLVKNGIKQGVLFREAIVNNKGEKYARLLETFFRHLPVFVKHNHFLAVHGGPVRGGITEDEIINIDNTLDYVWQFIWNRLNETRSNPSKREYSPDDVDMQRKLLKCPPDIPLIVGHNPMWKWGGEESFWVDPIGTKNHIILYSNLETTCPYISFKNSSNYEVKKANLKLKKKRFLMDN